MTTKTTTTTTTTSTLFKPLNTPPPTATTLLLSKLLDGNSSKNKKKAKTKLTTKVAASNVQKNSTTSSIGKINAITKLVANTTTVLSTSSSIGNKSFGNRNNVCTTSSVKQQQQLSQQHLPTTTSTSISKVGIRKPIGSIIISSSSSSNKRRIDIFGTVLDSNNVSLLNNNNITASTSSRLSKSSSSLLLCTDKHKKNKKHKRVRQESKINNDNNNNNNNTNISSVNDERILSKKRSRCHYTIDTAAPGRSISVNEVENTEIRNSTRESLSLHSNGMSHIPSNTLDTRSSTGREKLISSDQQQSIVVLHHTSANNNDINPTSIVPIENNKENNSDYNNECHSFDTCSNTSCNENNPISGDVKVGVDVSIFRTANNIVNVQKKRKLLYSINNKYQSTTDRNNNNSITISPVDANTTLCIDIGNRMIPTSQRTPATIVDEQNTIEQCNTMSQTTMLDSDIVLFNDKNTIDIHKDEDDSKIKNAEIENNNDEDNDVLSCTSFNTKSDDVDIVLPKPKVTFQDETSLPIQPYNNTTKKNTTNLLSLVQTKRQQQSSSSSSSSSSNSNSKKRQRDNDKNGNFVRLNLKNNSGSCYGARNKKIKSKSKLRWEANKKGYQQEQDKYINSQSNNSDNNNNYNQSSTIMDNWDNHKNQDSNDILFGTLHNQSNVNNNLHRTIAKNIDTDERNANGRRQSKVNSSVGVLAGVDPVDDYIDGLYSNVENSNSCTSSKIIDDEKSNDTTVTNHMMTNTTTDTKKPTTTRTTTTKISAIPLCTGHRQPCKLATVKKSGPNKGRQFYVCCLPRGEQCNHFHWLDDSPEKIQQALLSNTSNSGFIARHVASYVSQIKSLTMPELRKICELHKLNQQGKKAQLLSRLAIWVRDEISIGLKEDEEYKENKDETNDVSDADETITSRCDERVSVLTSTNQSKVDQPNLIAAINVNTESKEHSISSQPTTDIISNTIAAIEYNVESSDDTSDDEDDELEIFHDGVSSATAQCSFSNANERAVTTSSTCLETDTDVNTKDQLHKKLRELFGFNQFRPGQEWAIRRTLQGERSLLVAPTGLGKSLCYTLPAALMEGVCIVVSPLLSLIQDQIRLLPARIPAVTLSGSISAGAMVATLDDIAKGRIKIVFVSPERLTSASFRRLFRKVWNPTTNQYDNPKFPPVSLLCIDEAHCLSQWAHNFRPSYLRLRSVINIIQPKSILALTATAGPKVVRDLCTSLNIQQPASNYNEMITNPNVENFGVCISKTDRDNIDVQCFILANDDDRLMKLVKILSKGADKESTVNGSLASGSVIVYVWRQRDAELIAEYINMSGNIVGGVVVYHGGMASDDRIKAQSKFIRGKARICVATIAFGMGINKADVVGVVHMHLSSSPEHYIQEIGRAGRDGRSAKAISLLLEDEAAVKNSLAYSDSICRSQIRLVIQCLYDRLKEAWLQVHEQKSECANPIIYVSFPVDVAASYDLKQETLETIFSMLENRLGGENLLFTEGIVYDQCTVTTKRRSMMRLAEYEPLAKAILKSVGISTENIEKVDDVKIAVGSMHKSFTFSLAHCTNCLGNSAEPRHVYAALRRLEQKGDLECVFETTQKGKYWSIKMTAAGMLAFGIPNDDTCQMNQIETEISDRLESSITSCARKVLDLNYIMQRLHCIREKNVENETTSSSLQLFQKLIGSYFDAEGKNQSLLSAMEAESIPPCLSELEKIETQNDIRQIISYLLIAQGSDKRFSSVVSDPDKRPIVLLGDIANYPDYNALMVTKFLHGVAPKNNLYNCFRQHCLFGKLQQRLFTKVYEDVYSCLTSCN